MTCKKCNGLMVREVFVDFYLTEHMWRCVN